MLIIDQDTIVSYDSKVKELRKKADDKTLYYAGFFWYMIGRPEKAREYIDRGIKMNDRNMECLCVKGWMELATDAKQASLFFEKALS